jgi:Flp pilus assembly protein TadG
MHMNRFATLARLRGDRSGLALLEFALSAPIVLTLGLGGIEVGNQALVHMKLSQIALNLADNVSRVGSLSSTNIETIREGDINDVLQAARLQGDGIGLTTNGRVIVSSLENIRQSYDAAAVQRIHWQRCIGKKSGDGYDSSYGTTLSTDGTSDNVADAGKPAPNGMGDIGAQVNAPIASGLMFVEINYYYQPLVMNWIISPIRMHYTASLIVRNNRDFKQIYNPLGSATRSTCNLYKA